MHEEKYKEKSGEKCLNELTINLKAEFFKDYYGKFLLKSKMFCFNFSPDLLDSLL